MRSRSDQSGKENTYNLLHEVGDETLDGAQELIAHRLDLALLYITQCTREMVQEGKNRSDDTHQHTLTKELRQKTLNHKHWFIRI